MASSLLVLKGRRRQWLVQKALVGVIVAGKARPDFAEADPTGRSHFDSQVECISLRSPE